VIRRPHPHFPGNCWIVQLRRFQTLQPTSTCSCGQHQQDIDATQISYNGDMVNAKPPSIATIKAWQTKSPRYENATRPARVIYSLGLFSIQLPLIGLDLLFGTAFYGRHSWDFKFRSLRLLASYIIWSLNPGTRPRDDILHFPTLHARIQESSRKIAMPR
jgi:hypothetical protein